MAKRIVERGCSVLEFDVDVLPELGKKGWTLAGATGAEEEDQVVVGDRKFTHCQSRFVGLCWSSVVALLKEKPN